MIGSILVKYSNLDMNLPIDTFIYPSYNVEIFRNDILIVEYNHYFESDKLYSGYLEVGDFVRITFNHGNNNVFSSIIKRKDYTINTSNSDFGINEVIISPTIINNDDQTIYEFIIETSPLTYNFEYIVLGIGESFFEIGSGFSGVFEDPFVTDIDLLSDGKLLINGSFEFYKDVIKNRILKIDINGNIDTSFISGTGFQPDTTNSSFELNDGKIIIVGQFTNYNGTNVNRILKLNPNGTIDNTFNSGTSFNLDPRKVIQTKDGKILIGGFFWTYNNTSSIKLIKLNIDGSIDTSFNIGSGFRTNNEYENTVTGIYDLVEDSNGRIIAIGEFNQYNGNTFNKIVRLNSDASIDTSFNVGTGFNGVPNGLIIQPDGKIVIVGFFDEYNGVSVNRIVRLNSDGSIDPTFNIGSGFNGDATNVEIQPDGKLIITGAFSLYDNNSYNKIIRLNSDGSIDQTFNIGTGFDNTAYGILIHPNGNIYVGGNFTEYNGQPANKLARLSQFGILTNG